MRNALGRVASFVVVAAGWILLGARVVLDLVGYSTVPEDLEVAKTRLEQIVQGLLSVPWWAFMGFATVSTLWLMWLSWPRRLVAPERFASLPPPQANRAVLFGIRKSADNSNKEDGDHNSDIVRIDFWVKNTSSMFLDACRLKVEVSSYDYGNFERRFNGNLNPGETEYIFGFELHVSRGPDTLKWKKVNYRKERADEFKRMPTLIDLEFSFSAKDFIGVTKSFYLTDLLSPTDYILIGDDKAERDNIEAFAYSQ